ncbi:hypothetical protein BU15DRAFT_76205 [Melanogaster broomeanus]|nr:hypothetical protein BU15DRAFT_76205 [Melanogaster broomeanus]
MPPEPAVSLGRGPLIGTFLGLFLYGATCLQTFFYFQTYERDPRGLKLTVASLLTFETIHAALSIWVMDDYLIVHYGNVRALESPNWFVCISFLALFTGFDTPLPRRLSSSTYILGTDVPTKFTIDFFVYLYFTWRIWSCQSNYYPSSSLFMPRKSNAKSCSVTGSRWIVILMLSISISRTCVSILACVLSVLSPSWTTYLRNRRALIITGNVLFIAGDTFSASVMAYHLNSFRSWTHSNRTDREGPRRIETLINRLLIFAVATGALTSLVDAIALILTLTQPTSLAFLSAILVQTRLYANSLLASLNIRYAASRAYDGANDPRGGTEMAATSLQFALPPLDASVMSGGGGAAEEEGEEGSGQYSVSTPRLSTASSYQVFMREDDFPQEVDRGIVAYRAG